MTILTDQLVRGYGRSYGVDVAALGDLGWVARVEVGGSACNLGVTEAGGTALFSLYPLATLRGRECQPALMRRLLMLNAESHVVKYALDDEGDISLSVEFPAAALTFELFEAALDAICAAAAAHGAEIEGMTW